MTSLYTLTGQYLALQNMDMEPEDIADTLEAIEGEIEIKGKNICYVMANMDTQALDSEIKRLQAMKKAIVNRKESLKNYLRDSMLATDITKIEWDTGSITLRKPVQSVHIDDIDAIPTQYQRITVAADKTAIKAALKAGESLRGCSLVSGKPGLMLK